MPMFVDTSPPGECIFCKLVAGTLPCAQVYEDELTLAFMDLGQVNPGHVLVASKRHAVTLLELTAEEAGAVMQTAQRMAHAIQSAFDPEGITVLQANGAAAEQTVRHFHLHVVPRRRKDGLRGFFWPRARPSAHELRTVGDQLRAALTDEELR